MMLIHVITTVLDYLTLLWSATVCELIAGETDRYALQRGVAKWREARFGLSLALLSSWGSRDCLALVITGVETAS